MKFVFGSERARLVRERTKYVNDYNARKSRYDEQVQKFDEDSQNYASNMEDFIKAFLASELNNLPGTTLQVLALRGGSDDELQYYVKMFYKPPYIDSDNRRYRNSNYKVDVDSGYDNGFRWTFTIYIESKRDGYNEDGTAKWNKSLVKAPTINANIISADDYQALKYTYELFAKIETIDWQAILDKINSSVPKREEYVTEPNPGYLDTSDYDKAITHYDIARVMGKDTDTWIKVKIKREESYDSYNSTNPGVDGDGWIRVLSATDKFYTFNWLSGSNSSFSQDKITRALRYTVKLKKIYIFPVKPVEYATTEDLTADARPTITYDD